MMMTKKAKRILIAALINLLVWGGVILLAISYGPVAVIRDPHKAQLTANAKELVTEIIRYRTNSDAYPETLEDLISEKYLTKEEFEQLAYLDQEKTQTWLYKKNKPKASSTSICLWTPNAINGDYLAATVAGGVMRLNAEEFDSLAEKESLK